MLLWHVTDASLVATECCIFTLGEHNLGFCAFLPPFFWVEWLRWVSTSMCRHAGVVGYRPGVGAYFPPEHYYHWIDCHCELRHIHVNHCLDTVKELPRWNIGVYAAVDVINDELVLFAMHNVWFFSNEWCVKDARMVDHLGTLNKQYTVGQYAGDWS